MGPLLKLRNIPEKPKRTEDENVHISTVNLFLYLDQIVLLLGQSSNTIIFFNAQKIKFTWQHHKFPLSSENYAEKETNKEYFQREQQKNSFCGAPHINHGREKG